jgi:hypothetical protein
MRVPQILNLHTFSYHTGAAIGASSILLVKSDPHATPGASHPQGICVAILVNLQSVDTQNLAREILDIFEDTLN